MILIRIYKKKKYILCKGLEELFHTIDYKVTPE